MTALLGDGPLSWDAPGGGATAVAVAVVVGLLAAAFAARALSRRNAARRSAALGAAAARGLAVCAAILAAAAPHLVETRSDDSERLVAAASGANVRGLDADLVVTWPDDVPSAAAALEVLRAGAAPGQPADVLLRPGDDPPSGAEVERALRSDARIRAAILGDGGAQPGDSAPVVPAPRVVVPTGNVSGIPLTLTIDDAGVPFTGETATLAIEDREGEIVLPAGRRRVEAPPVDLPEGTHLVTLTIPGRAPAVAFVEVVPPPQVVFVTSDESAGQAVADVLIAQGVPTTVIAADRAARDGFGKADVLLLGRGASGTALDARVAGRVQNGTGLLVLGGQAEDGLRRHAGGMVEPLLPVTLPPEPPPPDPDPPEPDPPEPDPPPPAPPRDPDKLSVELEEGPKDALRVALLLVVDRSGSMAGSKIQLAKSAALAAAQNLDPQDRVGVLSFDHRFHWIAPFQDAEDISTLKRRLGGLQADGGTDFYGALKVGFKEIKRQRAGIRHVILFSDGATRPAVFKPIVDAAAADKITLSTIAVGDGADTRLLGLMAGWGKGRLYLATDPRRLPEVVTIDSRRFTTDVRDKKIAEMPPEERPEGLPDAPDTGEREDEPTASEPEREPEVEPEPEKPTAPEPRVPRVVADAAFLAGLEDAEWPAFAHPEDPTVRGVALVVLAWDEGEKLPALTLGRAGTARIAVLAADISTTDGRNVLAWDRGGAFLAQLVRSLAEPPPPDRGGIVASLAPALDGSARIAVPSDGDGLLRLRGSAPPEQLALQCGSMKPGWTGGRIPTTPAPGVLTGLFVPVADGAVPRRVALVSSGPARPARSALTELSAATGAPIVTAPPDRRSGPSDEKHDPVEAPLLGAAAALVLVEALLRRMV